MWQNREYVKEINPFFIWRHILYHNFRKGVLRMQRKIVIEGNAFYEVDEECLQRKEQKEKEEQEEKR